MIPAHNPYLAVYAAGLRAETRRPVEAWGEQDGVPYVLSEDDKVLVPADALPGFIGVEPAYDTPKVAVLPGGGWRCVKLKLNGDIDEEYWVIGWVVAGNGWATPLIVKDLNEARARPVSVMDDELRLIPPPAPRAPE